jgi:hypothetical protein
VSDLHASRKASSFTESVIRKMTRLAHEHGAINLGQGMPDFAAPEEVKEAARRAIAEDHNQYPITWGVPEFREAIAGRLQALVRTAWQAGGSWFCRSNPEPKDCSSRPGSRLGWSWWAQLA